MLWVLGVYLLPIQIYALVTEAVIEPLIVIGWVAAGGYGLVALFAVLREIFFKTQKRLSPRVVLPGLVVGFLAVLPFIHPAFPTPWNFLAIAPMAATIHMAYLGRNYLFDKDT